MFRIWSKIPIILFVLVIFPCTVVAQNKLPNILFILTDDQRADELIGMPTIEKLSRSGITFNSAFVTTPSCSPARASILSGGLYAHKTGVLSNVDWNKFGDTTTIATLLQGVGYRTGFIGKYLHGYRPGYIPPGWNFFVANNQGGMMRDWFNLRDITTGSSNEKAATGQILKEHSQYVTYFQRDQALKFLDENDGNPFFLMLSTYAPHAPKPPAPEDAENHFVLPELPEESDMTDKPEWVKKAALHKKLPWSKASGNSAKFFENQRQKAAQSLAAVDRSVAEILTKIETLGLASNTIIIFTSDNGMMAGEHGLHDKGAPYDPSIRVPLIIKSPGIQPGQRNDLVAMNLDLSATFFDIAGIKQKTDGVSLLPILNGGVKGERTDMVIESGGYLSWWSRFDFHSEGLGYWTGIRTQDWKYIEHPTGETELYDMNLDPHEMENKADDPGFADIKSQLSKRHDQIKKVVK